MVDSGTERRVVVGVAGYGRHSDAGVVWALREAERRSAVLEVVHAWQPAVAVGYPYGALDTWDTQDEQDAHAVAAGALQRARARTACRPVDVEVVARRGPAAAVLEAAALRAELVVVTRQHDTALGRVLLGSVTTAVLHHADCDVAVVPHERSGEDEPLDGPPDSVVVGCDHEEHTERAVRAAGRWAADARTVLRAVVVRPVVVRPVAAERELDALAEGQVRADVTRLTGDLPVKVETAVLVGRAGRELVAACGPHDALVVGSRPRHGHGPGWLLGSVSGYAATHARCPVLVVR